MPSHCFTLDRRQRNQKTANHSRGISLIVVLLILVIVSLLGVASIQISRTATQAARNERDTQIAWQAAEAALLDAELDILGMPATATTSRGDVFNNKNVDVHQFLENCGSDAKNKGLCKAKETGTPNWLSIDFLTTSNPRYVEFGEYTSRTFQAGSSGIQPAHPPRYIIELLDDPNIERTRAVDNRKYIYRITAIGFGPNERTQVVLQSIYRN